MNRYSTIDVTKWCVVEAAPLSVSGQNEIVGTFVWKDEAVAFARRRYGRRWRSHASVVRREAVR